MIRRFSTIVGLALVLAACSDAAPESTVPEETTTTSQVASAPETTEAPVSSSPDPVDEGFPVSVEVGGVEVVLDSRPERIVSLSPTATETLFAIGAGEQVVAVDTFSTYPDEAPITDLSGYTPNIEAIAAYDPDLIVISFDPDGMIASAFVPQGVAVVSQYPALGREDLLAQIEQLGALTGHLDRAVVLTGEISDRWDAAETADAGGASIYIEVDPTFYSASSYSFMGSALTGLGFENIADAADSSMTGFPQLSAEAIIEADPAVIVIGTDTSTTAEDVSSRPGWASIGAVAGDRVIVVDSDLASRWGPRFVEYVELMAALAESLANAGT